MSRPVNTLRIVMDENNVRENTRTVYFNLARLQQMLDRLPNPENSLKNTPFRSPKNK